MLGDSHNFGKSVTQQRLDGVSYYSKPRPVYWEWLFFGYDSPLRVAFSQAVDFQFGVSQSMAYPPSIAETLFGLEVEIERSSKYGRVKGIEKTTLAKQGDRENVLHGYGALIAYAYVFGILDLHNENIIISEGRPQVIDAEIVFTKLLIPDETLLLPFKDVPFKDSALSLICLSPEDLLPKEVELILLGFAHGLMATDKYLDKILEIFSQVSVDIATTPVRVILRNTRKYYGYLDGTFPMELMPEELEQLSRGEIPYFFKFTGRPNLFYYTSPSGEFDEASVPPSFTSAVERVGVPPSELLSSSRIRNKQFGPGLLLLMRKLMPSDWVGHINALAVSLEFSSNELIVESEWGNFRTNRFRKLG